jgi:hypothetical protein
MTQRVRSIKEVINFAGQTTGSTGEGVMFIRPQ